MFSPDKDEHTRTIEESENPEYWGSLPVQTVLFHEARIEEIRDDMEALELNELKAHVRDAHFFSMSRRASSLSSDDRGDDAISYSHMDDFTAVVTTTIMQALPTIFRLEALLGVWEVRLAVLRSIPGFLNTRQQLRAEMSAAWEVLRPDTDGTLAQEKTSKTLILKLKATLETGIKDLGRRIDYMLDTLEGHKDAIPDPWIDDMERLEHEFGTWSNESGKILLQDALRFEEDNIRTNENGVFNGESLHKSCDSEQIGDSSDETNRSRVLDEIKKKNDKSEVEQRDTQTYEKDIYPKAISLQSSKHRLNLDGEMIPNNAYSAHVVASHAALLGGPEPFAHDTKSKMHDSSDLDGSYSPPQSPSLQPYISGISEFRVNKSDTIKKSLSNRPMALNLRHQRNVSDVPSDFSSETSYAGSATSDYFSNMSSPEIQDASRTEYFGAGTPIEVTTPSVSHRKSSSHDDSVSRHSSQRTERGDRPMSALASPSTRSRASTLIQDSTIHENGDPDKATIDLYQHTSFDVKRDEILGDSSEERSEGQNSGLALLSGASPSIAGASSAGIGGNLHGDGGSNFALPTPPIPPKSRHRFEDVTDLSPRNTPVKIIRRKTADAVTTPVLPQTPKNRAAASSPTKNADEQLEACINSILTDLPGNIRLTNGSEANTPDGTHAPINFSSKLSKKSPIPHFNRSQTAAPSSPAITLTPSKHKVARTQTGEPGVKLYHLHQSGKEAPIKLFVRLVGEGGERVMVRIGGGWADLGEYLKEYAIHHGRRTVSDGRFEIQGLPQPQTNSPTTAATYSPIIQTPRSGPESPAAERQSSAGISGHRSPRYSVGSSPGHMKPLTPDIASSPTFNDDIYPSSPDSNSSRRSWNMNDSPSLGLAGPRSKTSEVSPKKQAWVDTMLEKARKGPHSGEQKKQSQKEGFGDLGIVGGTKRLFMRGRREAT